MIGAPLYLYRIEVKISLESDIKCCAIHFVGDLLSAVVRAQIVRNFSTIYSLST